MRNNYFEDWLASVDKNLCYKCNGVTSEKKNNKINELTHVDLVTPCHFQAAASVTNYEAVTPVTIIETSSCNNHVKEKHLKINDLPGPLHLLLLLQEKNNETQLIDNGEAMFESLKTKPTIVKVRCKDCSHFARDKIGFGDGIGSCSIKFDESREHGDMPLYPSVKRVCAAFVKSNINQQTKMR